MTTWTATGDGWTLTWSPSAPYLTGTPSIVAAVLSILAGPGPIAVIPTGPFAPRSAADPHAVFAALRAVASFDRLTGDDVPRVPATPRGTVA